MDFKRPERCRWQRTGRENRRSNFYEISDNLCESYERPTEALKAMVDAVQTGLPFELAILDFNMPDMNGSELARAIRGQPALKLLKLVVLSSGHIETELQSDAGVCAVLSKPARQSDLRRAIFDAITGTSRQSEDAPGAAAISEPEGPLVLIAEDNEINRSVAKALLAKRGFRAALAHNGAEAVQRATENDYAAILMDCQMPELDGYEATKRIRAGETDRHVPIIAMTAHSMTGDRERCLAAGMDDYLSKPVRNEALDEVLSRWLPRHEPSASPVAAPAESPSVPTDVLDQAAIRQLRDTLTPEMRTSLVATFEDSQARCVAEIEQSIERDDQIELRRVAHLLKGSSATLGATRLRLVCERLQHTGRAEDPPIGQARLGELRAVASEAVQALREHLL